ALSTIVKDTNGKDSKLAFGFTKYVLDINEGYISFVEPVPESFGIGGEYGVGIQYIDYGSFVERDTKGEELGTFGASDLAVSLGYSGKFPSNIHYGLAVKVISSH